MWTGRRGCTHHRWAGSWRLVLSRNCVQTSVCMWTHVEYGQVEEEAHAMDAHSQDVLQLAYHCACVLQSQGQILAVLIHRHHCIPHVLGAQSHTIKIRSRAVLCPATPTRRLEGMHTVSDLVFAMQADYAISELSLKHMVAAIHASRARASDCTLYHAYYCTMKRHASQPCPCHVEKLWGDVSKMSQTRDVGHMSSCEQTCRLMWPLCLNLSIKCMQSQAGKASDIHVAQGMWEEHYDRPVS